MLQGLPLQGLLSHSWKCGVYEQAQLNADFSVWFGKPQELGC